VLTTQHHGGLIHLAGGTISKTQVQETWRDAPLAVIDRYLELANLSVTNSTYDALATFSRASGRWERADLFHLILLAPDSRSPSRVLKN